MPGNVHPSFVDFRAVKAQVTMQQVLTHYGLFAAMKPGQDSLSGTCPIHKGTNPTQFRVSLSKNCWNCFGDCQAGGNVLDFVSRMENCDVRHAAYRLAEWFGLELTPREGNRPPGRSAPARQSSPQTAAPVAPDTAAPATLAPTTPSPTSASEPVGANKPLGFTLRDLDASHPYLAQRGLAPETITEFGIGLCNAGTMIGRIVIPIHNPAGELVGYIGRWPGHPPGETPKYKLPKGFRKSAEVFNLHRAVRESPEQPLVIVEGVFDAMTLWEHGIRRVVALMGSSLSPAQELLLRQHTGRLDRILVMFDEDEAGRTGRADLAQRLTRFAFVKVHVFAAEGQQPEQLTQEELTAILA